MLEPTHRRRNRLLACAGLLLGALAVLHASYPLSYVAKVLIYGNDGYPAGYDIPLANVQASAAPNPLPRSLDSRVDELLPQFAGIDDAGQFLDSSGTTALVVVAGGQIVAETYLRDRTAQSLDRTYSVTKAVLCALVGVALQDGVLQLDAPVTQYVPELAVRDANFKRIVVGDLLNMRSGLAYTPGLRFPFLSADDALLYYHPDIESIVLGRADVAEPPGAFDYHPYNSALLGLILRRATRTTLADYLQNKLWAPLGAESSAQWVTDESGFEMMASGLRATPADLAKLGLLYLREGRVGERALMPAAWTALPSPDGVAPTRDAGERPYQNGWWLVSRPDGGWDFSATGSYGQYLYVSPENDVVIVRTGLSRGGWKDDQWFALFAFLAERIDDSLQRDAQTGRL